MFPVYVSAKVDYATRALIAIAAARGEPVPGVTLATREGLPVKFVENILVDLRRAGFVTSQRGNTGGYRLARPADQIAIADVMRALEGPLAEVRGERPEEISYSGAAEHLPKVWIAVRAALRSVLEEVTVGDVMNGRFPDAVAALIADPEAWAVHHR